MRVGVTIWPSFESVKSEFDNGATQLGLACQMLRQLFVAALVVVASPDALASDVDYLVALSPDGSRVAIGKSEKRPRWSLFEGSLKQPLRTVPLPANTYGTGVFQYSPDGKELLFATAPSTPASTAPGIGRDTLWRRQLGIGDETPSIKIFEHDALSNVLPLLDGSIVFMSAVRLVAKPGFPLQSGGNTWTNYSWMLRKADGSVTVVNPRQYAFYSKANLIRDEAVFFEEQRFVNNRAVIPKEFHINITALKPGADLSDLAPLGAGQYNDQPELQCNWSGKTCIRTMTYTKNKYYAHQLEIFREGKPCKVTGLPDRLERIAISRDGNAVALITRPNPYQSVGYQLAQFRIGDNGCANAMTSVGLP